MLYSSTRGGDNDKSFVDVLLKGLAKDGGLYVPNKIPYFNRKKLESLSSLNYSELCFEITKEFVCNEISFKTYKEICEKTYSDFSSKKKIISIEKLNEKEFILNLFHGPTFAFKDYALQLLGNLYDYILKKKKINLTVLGATSGDTGSAAIYGCSKSSNLKLFILFPKGKVSEIQRKQMTTYKKSNVFNIEVNGNFDDCQRLVKKFFVENNKYNLAAINSINWVRIMGQIVYYFWSFLRVEKELEPLSFVVPTGNFGNVYAGFCANKMGLPIKNLVVASNKNDILTRFFKSGKMKVMKTSSSLSPSMDIQVSSNFERFLFYFCKDANKVKKLFRDLEKKGFFSIEDDLFKKMISNFKSDKLSDNETIKTISEAFKQHKLILDPHSAVGFSVGKKVLKDCEKRIYLATAHYGKFLPTVKKSIGDKCDYPQELKNVLNKKETFISIENDIKELKRIISSNTN